MAHRSRVHQPTGRCDRLRLAVSTTFAGNFAGNFAGKAMESIVACAVACPRSHPSRRAPRLAMMAWRAPAVASALEEDLEQFQGGDNDEEGGDDHEHGANPTPC